MKKILLLVLFALALPLNLCRAESISNDDCLTCHADKDIAVKEVGGKKIPVFVDKEKFARSIHGKNLCTSCHSDIKENPHPETLKPVSCGQCHRIETEIYLTSDHGVAVHRGVREAASCRDCHGNEHELLKSRDPNSPVFRANIPATCARCHEKTGEMAKFQLEQQAPISSYTRSVHGIALAEKKSSAAVCTDCHGSHDLHKGTNPASKLFWQNIPTTCGKCHENVKQTYLRSVHGQSAVAGKRESPVCTNCHGEHTITAVKLATSKVFPSHITETCGQCHRAEHITTRYGLPPKVVETYLQSFHGLAQQFGELTVANCDSCHGAHDILPAEDPRSSVNMANLPQTCGKCHPGIGTRLAVATLRIHSPPGAAEGKPWIVNLVVRLYIVFIVLTVGGMLLHNALDYFVKVRAHIRQVRASDGETRLSAWERAQHLALIVTFVLLVYTGFVHKFPEAFFSWPFRVIPEGSFVRGLIHRISGGVFIVLMIVHFIALLGTRRGRDELREMLPRPKDVKEAWGMLAYNLGWRSSPPERGRFNYVEKSEYWALIWGSVIMTVTGIMLMFTELVMRWLPQVWLDLAQVIHYYEAVLATLAILVWHFYATIFDPHEYPMNPSWLISKKAPFRHGQEAEPPSLSPGPDSKAASLPPVAASGSSASPDHTEVS